MYSGYFCTCTKYTYTCIRVLTANPSTKLERNYKIDIFNKVSLDDTRPALHLKTFLNCFLNLKFMKVEIFLWNDMKLSENEFEVIWIWKKNTLLNVEHVLYESLAQKLGWQFTGRSKSTCRVITRTIEASSTCRVIQMQSSGAAAQ